MRRQRTPSILPPSASGDLKSQTDGPVQPTTDRHDTQAFAPSEYGAEIGGTPSFKKLPHTIDKANGKGARRTFAPVATSDQFISWFVV